MHIFIYIASETNDGNSKFRRETSLPYAHLRWFLTSAKNVMHWQNKYSLLQYIAREQRSIGVFSDATGCCSFMMERTL